MRGTGEKMKKVVKIILIAIIISYTILYQINPNKSYAVVQTTSNDIENIDENKYQNIKNQIKALKEQYPNWNFKILYTGLDWNEVIQNEYVGHTTSSRNYVPSTYSSEWICPICGDKAYDNGSWRCASESAIKYSMDARNFINSSQIFQFLELTYSNCSENEIGTMVRGTFLDNASYIQAILQAGQSNNVNPYYIAARILQEQGKNGTTLTKGQGYNGQYVGYYNIFNIGASGSGTSTIILNGLKRAEKEGWTSLEASIIGGTQIIAKQYIAVGQNTLYLQKFDVDNSDEKLYWHQYQQNLIAAQNEGSKMKSTIENVNALSNSYTFIIPIYENMPAQISPKPGENNSGNVSNPTESTADLVRVNVTGTLYLRDAPNGNKLSKYLKAGEIVTRLEKATSKVNGTYWDYVMKSDGTKGYAARETYESESTYKLYLVPVNEQSSGSIDTDINKVDVKIDNNAKTVTVTPTITAKEIKEQMTDAVITDSTGRVIGDDEKVGTGYKVNNELTIVKKGDCNEDADINSADLLKIQKHLLEVKKIEEEDIKQSADANNDGNINSADLLKIQKYLLGATKIEL